MRRLVLPFLLLILTSCGSGRPEAADSPDALEAELAEGQSVNAIDPQVMTALYDPIMVDPQLTAKSNADAVRPPPSPYSAAVPDPSAASGSSMDKSGSSSPAPAARPLADPAARKAITLTALAHANGARCASRLAYSAAWAARMPDDLALHPDARVIEAAGVDGGGCALRTVSFRVARPWGQVLGWDYARAGQAGFSAEHQADGALHLLKGGRGGVRYALYLTDRGDSGTDAEFIRDGN